MNARVVADYRWNRVTAFAGHEFVKGEYRPVPAGHEQDAKAHPLLEVEPAAKAARGRKPAAKVGSAAA